MPKDFCSISISRFKIFNEPFTMIDHDTSLIIINGDCEVDHAVRKPFDFAAVKTQLLCVAWRSLPLRSGRLFNRNILLTRHVRNRFLIVFTALIRSLSDFHPLRGRSNFHSFVALIGISFKAEHLPCILISSQAHNFIRPFLLIKLSLQLLLHFTLWL